MEEIDLPETERGWWDSVLTAENSLLYGPGHDVEGEYHEGTDWFMDALRAKHAHRYGQEEADRLYPRKPKVTEKFAREWYDLDSVENIEPVSFLVDKFLVRNSIVELFADPGVGKSFLALDWALHIASGKDWGPFKIEQPEAVVYVVGESLEGYPPRLAAWQKANGQIKGDARRNFHMLGVPINILDQREVEGILPDIMSKGPALVVIDTLARATAGGDINTTKDMSKAVNNLEIIRSATKACVLLIHHTGHADKSRGRGAIDLPGALETDLGLSRTGENGLKLTMAKQKNAEELKPYALLTEKVEITVRDREMTSLVIKHGTADDQVAVVENAWFTPEVRKGLEDLVGLPESDRTSGHWQSTTGLANGPFYALQKVLKENRMVEGVKHGNKTMWNVLRTVPERSWDILTEENK